MTILNGTVASSVATSVQSDPDRAIRVAHAYNYPNRVWFCIATLIAVVSLSHIFSILTRTLHRRWRSEPSSRRTVALYRLPLAISNAFRAVVFRSTIQIGPSFSLNLAELFLTAAYITIIFVWSLVNSTNTTGMKYDPKYWANIAANIACTQLPLVAVLGTKNNFLSYLTGISYEKLEYLHKMTARAMCVLIWVHASGRIKIGLTGDSWKLPWVQCGVLAAVAFSVLSILSIRPLRRRHYECFLVLHFTMVLIVLLGGYFHARQNSQGNRVWPSILIWGLDRALRWIRILICNAGYLQKSSREQQYGNLEVLSPQFIRVSVKRPAYIHWRPGQSMHLTIPGASSSMFEAHPFTISTIDTPRIVDVQDNENDIDGKDDGSSEEFEFDLKTLTFIIRVRSGFTRRLFSRASDKARGLQVFLDGPYGSPPSLRGFNTVVLIAGGSGVTFTLPLLLDVIRHAKEGTTDCTRLSFIWALRDNNINWIMDTLRPAMTNIPAGIIVSINIYLTTSDGEESIEANDKSNIEHLISPGVVGLHIKHGRPDLQHLVETEVAQTIGAISFNVCGNHSMSNAVRSTLRRPRFVEVLRGGATVSLHVESFGNT